MARIKAAIGNRLFGRGTAQIRNFVFMAVWVGCPSAVFAGVITLGSAQSFAVLGGAGVSVNGTCCTVISGSLGDDPLGLSSITGFPTPGSLVNGSFYALDQLPLIAQQARADENTAYGALAALASTADESGIVLGTGGTVSTLLPGVYTFSSSAEVDGGLTLNFNGQSNARFVFQIVTTLTTGSSAAINVIGANSTDAIYWQVGTSAILGSSTAFVGNILASDAITLDPSASIACGRAFAYTQSVTLAATNFISDNCGLYNTSTGYSSTGPGDFGSYGFSGNAPGSNTPEPAAFLLMGIGLAGLAVKYSFQKG
jgi:Ice-binding-like/PEP-CTERM motif